MIANKPTPPVTKCVVILCYFIYNIKVINSLLVKIFYIGFEHIYYDYISYNIPEVRLLELLTLSKALIIITLM